MDLQLYTSKKTPVSSLTVVSAIQGLAKALLHLLLISGQKQ